MTMTCQTQFKLVPSGLVGLNWPRGLQFRQVKGITNKRFCLFHKQLAFYYSTPTPRGPGAPAAATLPRNHHLAHPTPRH